MTDWADVLRARGDADAIAARAETALVDHGETESAAVFALLAIKEELRALGDTIDRARGSQ